MSATMMAIELPLQSLNSNGRGPTSGEILSGLAREVDQFLTGRIGGESFVEIARRIIDNMNAFASGAVQKLETDCSGDKHDS
jgi:hypothetical protein